MQRRGFNHTVFIVFFLLLAFSLRIFDAGNWPVRLDEAFSVWGAQMGFVDGTEFTARDVHPPVYYWLLHIWLRLTGSSEFAIRMLSVLLSLVTISAVYTITFRLSRKKLAAVLAVLLITVSPYHIQWSQDARMYALATMFASLTIYAHLRNRTRLLAISGVGAALSHYFGAIVVGVIFLHEILVRRDTGYKRRQWFIANAFIIVICSVWAAYTIGLMRKDPSFATFDPQAAFLTMAGVFAVNSSTHLGAFTLHVQLITSIFFFGLFLSWRHHPRATSFIVIGCLLPPAIIALMGLPFVPIHVNALQERYFNVFAPFVFAGFGVGLNTILNTRRLRLVGAFIVIGLLVFNGSLVLKRADKRYFQDDYRTMMAAVAALTNADDKVFFISGGRKAMVYYHLERVGYDVPKNAYAEPVNVRGIPRRSEEDVSATMEWIFAGIDRFWLIEIEAHLDEPRDAPLRWIKDNYYRIYHIPVAWNGISLYSNDLNDTIPDIESVIPPVVTEARPGDQVRIGVPAGATVDLVHSGQTIDSHTAETWMLHQFDIYPFYFNGFYELRVADQSYPFMITHSQDFPGGT